MLTEEYSPQQNIQNQYASPNDQIQESNYLQQPINNLKSKQIVNNSIILFSNQSQQQSVLIFQKDATKKLLQNKIKYKKIKQKLITLTQQIQDQGIIKDQKDLTSPNKSRLIKLALEFQKSLKTQVIDYSFIQSTLKEIQKIVQYKRQHDILILRGARLMSTILALIKRYPSLHKTQALQSMNSVEQIVTDNAINCVKQRIFVDFQSIVNHNYIIELCLDEGVEEDSNKLFNYAEFDPKQCDKDLTGLTNKIKYLVYVVFFSTKKIQNVYLTMFIVRRFFQFLVFSAWIQILLSYHQEILLKVNNMLSSELERPIYQCNIMNNLTKTMTNYFQHLIHMLQKSVIDLVYQKEEDQYILKDQNIANFKINSLLFIFKTLNIIFHVDISSAQKNVQCNQLFVKCILFILKYTKQYFQQNQQTKNLCSQLIIFLGNLAYQHLTYQNLIRQKGILQQLCDLPMDYMMQPLKHLFISSFCCIIYLNQKNHSQAFKQNSVLTYLQYIQKQIVFISDHKNQQQIICDPNKDLFNKQLSRKTSVSSLNSKYSIAQSYTTQTSGINMKQKHLDYKFCPNKWEILVHDLKKYDD